MVTAFDADPSRRGIRQVARAAGVSLSTVSNVINHPDRVALETRRRVEHAMAEIGFIHNRAASQLRGTPSSVVGCVILDSANVFFADVGRGIEDRLAEAGCMLLVCSTDVQVARERRYLTMLEEHGVRGILISPVSKRLDELARISQRGTPVVLLDHPKETMGLCAAATDNVLGGQLAMEHLLSLGHRHIAYLRGSIDVRSLIDREQGALRAIREAGLDARETMHTVYLRAPVTQQVIEASIGGLLARSPAPTAVMCSNDEAAFGLIRGLRQLGISVPRDISVIGYDDVRFASQLFPPLTTVRQPTYQLGRVAAELLLAEGQDSHRHQEAMFRPEVVIRESTAAV